MPERTDSAIALVDKMISCKVFKEPEADQRTEEYYDVYKLEFTDEFDHDFRETLQRLASDPHNEFLSLLEGLKSGPLNYLKEDEVDEEDLEEMAMMVFSLTTVNDDVGKKT